MSKIYYNPFSRRMFLRSATGIAMSIPVLPSLIPKNVKAQTTLPKKSFFFTYGSQSNPYQNLLPHVTGAVPQTILQPGKPYFSQNLVELLAQRQSEGAGQLANSIPLGTSETGLAGMLNLIHGIDSVQHIGRKDHSGDSFWNGNPAAQKEFGNIDWQAGPASVVFAMPSIQTIDYILQDLGLYSQKPIWALGKGSASNRFDPNRRHYVTGELVGTQLTPGYNAIGYTGQAPNTFGSNPNALFLEFFSNSGGGSAPGVSPLIAGVDLVLNAYNSINNGQISSVDSLALERHMDSMNELRTSLQNSQPTGTCSVPANNYINLSNDQIIESSSPATLNTVMNQTLGLATTAMLCGLTDNVTFSMDKLVADNQIYCHRSVEGSPRRWHLEVAHQEQTALITSLVNRANGYFLDFCRMLDVPNANGESTLKEDCWGQIVSDTSMGHSGFNNCFITAGSAQGGFNTGKFFNYEDPIASNAVTYRDNIFHVGLPVNRLWATNLLANGVSSMDLIKDAYGNQNRAAGHSNGHGHYAQNPPGNESFFSDFDRWADAEHFEKIDVALPGMLV